MASCSGRCQTLKLLVVSLDVRVCVRDALQWSSGVIPVYVGNISSTTKENATAVYILWADTELIKWAVNGYTVLSKNEINAGSSEKEGKGESINATLAGWGKGRILEFVMVKHSAEGFTMNERKSRWFNGRYHCTDRTGVSSYHATVVVGNDNFVGRPLLPRQLTWPPIKLITPSSEF